MGVVKKWFSVLCCLHCTLFAMESHKETYVPYLEEQAMAHIIREWPHPNINLHNLNRIVIEPLTEKACQEIDALEKEIATNIKHAIKNFLPFDIQIIPHHFRPEIREKLNNILIKRCIADEFHLFFEMPHHSKKALAQCIYAINHGANHDKGIHFLKHIIEYNQPTNNFPLIHELVWSTISCNRTHPDDYFYAFKQCLSKYMIYGQHDEYIKLADLLLNHGIKSHLYSYLESQPYLFAELLYKGAESKIEKLIPIIQSALNIGMHPFATLCTRKAAYQKGYTQLHSLLKSKNKGESYDTV